MESLAELDPADRKSAKADTSAAEALAWLEDPQPPPPPETLQQEIAREIAEAIGWPVARVQEAITELHELDPEKRKCLVSHQTKSWPSCGSNSGHSTAQPSATDAPPTSNTADGANDAAAKPTAATSE